MNQRLLSNELVATEWIQGLHNGLNSNTRTMIQLGERLNISHITLTSEISSIKEVVSYSSTRLDLVI